MRRRDPCRSSAITDLEQTPVSDLSRSRLGSDGADTFFFEGPVSDDQGNPESLAEITNELLVLVRLGSAEMMIDVSAREAPLLLAQRRESEQQQSGINPTRYSDDDV